MQTLFLVRRLHLPPTEGAVQSCQFSLQFSSGAQQLILQAQLLLTTSRDAFRGQSRSPNMVPFEVLGMLSCLCTIITLSLRDIRYFFRYSTCKLYNDLETRVRGHSRLSGPTHNDPPPMTSYQRSIVITADVILFPSQTMSSVEDR